MSEHSFGWLRDLPDQRDRLFAFAPEVGGLPAKVDLRPSELAGVSDIYDQGALSSCVAHAVARLIEYGYVVKQGRAPLWPSRLFIYWGARELNGWQGQDAGSFLRDAIKFTAANGVCPESEWPYDHLDTRVFQKPPDEAYLNAPNFEDIAYERVPQSLTALKSCLVAGSPFVCGFTVYESFDTAAVAATGLVPMPGMSERALGGHAAAVVGYDDNSRTGDFLVANSWGPNWGQKGYCWVPYEYFDSPSLAADFWRVTL